MRLLCFSDWRIQPIEDIYRLLNNMDEKPDFILYGGDDIDRFQEELTNHFSQIAKLSRQGHILVVAGNDDSVLLKTVFKSEGIIDLHDSCFSFDNFAFLGLEGSTRGPGLLQYSEKEVNKHLEKQLKESNGKTFIVLSHTPPFGTLDLGIRFADPVAGVTHIGSTALRDFVTKSQPALVICGHAHSQGRRIDRIGRTSVLNIASHDSPGSAGNFALVEINESGHCAFSFIGTEDLLPPNSLLNIHGVGLLVQKALDQAGIKNIDQLLEAPDLYKISDLSSLPFLTICRIKAKAKAFKAGQPFKIKDFSLDFNEVVFFDIETDTACERVWLIGALSKNGFKQFYADDWIDEPLMLRNFLSYLKLTPNALLVSYSGTNFDRNVIEKALRRQHLDYKSFLAFRHIDLSLIIKDCFIFPTQSYALKNLAAHLNYKFKHPELNGFLVAIEYMRHIIDKIPLNPIFLEYNEDDVRSLPFIIEELKKLNQESKTNSIAEISKTDKQKSFREFVEELQLQGIKGEKYREKIAEWNNQHK